MGIDPLAEARRQRREARTPKALGFSAPPPALLNTPTCLPPPLPSPVPRSILYVPEFIDADDEALLLMHVRQAPPERWSGAPGDGRRTQNYGGAPGSLAVAEGLPAWLAPLVHALVESGAWGDVPPPNHILINVFKPGAGLVPHTDGPLYAGPRVATISLGSDVVLRLHQPSAAEHETSLLLRRRSLNVISGEAYARWHGIAESATDYIDDRVANVAEAGAAVGDVVTRGDRVSIVFVRKMDG